LSDVPRFGCLTVQEIPRDELFAAWARIEDAGFDGLWLADHVMTFPKMGALMEAWTTLAAAAMRTERVRLGTLVTNITYRDPVLVAKEAITIDHLSGGRLDLGIGAAGTRDGDARVAGVDTWSTPERVRRFAEFVELVDGLMSGEIESFSGKYYSTGSFGRGPWPVQKPRPPLVIAANGPKTLRVAARFADEWNALAGWGHKGDDLFEFLRSSNARLDDFAADAGRDPSTIRRSALVGEAGFEWWDSADALQDFVWKMRASGIQDLVFYYPTSQAAAGGAFQARSFELLAESLPALRKDE
jgi:alkanesulfonate monooxygenase SsuD/methylene tetrahydromethanopterin reductase-like flavin-dependent oxidoreductase (luciferase family)